MYQGVFNVRFSYRYQPITNSNGSSIMTGQLLIDPIFCFLLNVFQFNFNFEFIAEMPG